MRVLAFAAVPLASCTTFAAAPSDAGIEASAPAMAPCTCDGNGLVVGSSSIAGKLDDVITPPAMDAHLFAAARAATARCACLFVARASRTTVRLGIYADSPSTTGGDDPGMLLATAELAVEGAGWVGAPLDRTLPVAAGDRLWLSIAPSTEIHVESTDVACTVTGHTERIEASAPLPPAFVTDQTFDRCDVAAYVSE